MSGCGLMSLIAYGAQDFYLTGNPILEDYCTQCKDTFKEDRIFFNKKTKFRIRNYLNLYFCYDVSNLIFDLIEYEHKCHWCLHEDCLESMKSFSTKNKVKRHFRDTHLASLSNKTDLQYRIEFARVIDRGPNFGYQNRTDMDYINRRQNKRNKQLCKRRK